MVDTAFYNEMAELAVELIGDFGESGSFVKKGQAGGTDDYGQVIPATPDVTITGTVTPRLSFKQHEVDGTNILSSDSYVFFDGGEPEIGMRITLNGVVYRVVANMGFMTVGDKLIFNRVQLRA